MLPVLFAGALQYFLGILMFFTAIFLVLLVLVQRGRGGGLAGALGGMGGQSAFGSKAGDTFTKITVWAAVFWIVLCVVSVKYLGNTSKFGGVPSATGTNGLSSGDSTSVGDGLPESGQATEADQPGGDNAQSGQKQPAGDSDTGTGTPDSADP